MQQVVSRVADGRTGSAAEQEGNATSAMCHQMAIMMMWNGLPNHLHLPTRVGQSTNTALPPACDAARNQLTLLLRPTQGVTNGWRPCAGQAVCGGQPTNTMLPPSAAAAAPHSPCQVSQMVGGLALDKLYVVLHLNEEQEADVAAEMWSRGFYG